MEKQILRGEVYFANLDPVIGSEQGGYRPALIIQNNTGNRYSGTVIIACITSKAKTKLPTHVPLVQMNGLPKHSMLLMEQLRTVDKNRIGDFVGALDSGLMNKADTALSISLGLPRAMNIMTLCPHCYKQFADSEAYILRRVHRDQQVRESCTMCSYRAGYDFEIIKM